MLYLVAMLVLLIIVLFVWLRPVPATVASYIWWRAVSGTTVTEGSITSGDAQIYYRKYGAGRPVVLLHGGLSSSLDWMGVLPSLSQHFQVITIDLRGHGQSTMGNTRFTYRLLAADVRTILDGIGIERSNFVGWSDGGNVSMLFALDYPERIDHLITISANFHPSGINDDVLEQLGTSPEEAGSWLSRAIYRVQSPEPDRWPDLRQYVTDMWQSYPRLTTEDLNQIQVPTLVVVGADDYIDREHAVEMTDSIPNARLLVIPNVAHAVPRETPRRVLDAITQFISAK